MTDQKRRNPAGGPGSNVHSLTADKTEHSLSLPQRQVSRLAEDPVMGRAVAHICAHGDRAVLELLSTLAEKHIQAIAVEAEIRRFALLPAGALAALGCDRIRHLSPYEVSHV